MSEVGGNISDRYRSDTIKILLATGQIQEEEYNLTKLGVWQFLMLRQATLRQRGNVHGSFVQATHTIADSNVTVIIFLT